MARSVVVVDVGDRLRWLGPGLCQLERTGQTLVFQLCLAKAASSKPIPPGARWITVHPHGPDEPGQPVLIQPHPDGTATVIGGAGGALNYLRLTRLRSESEWKEAAQKRRENKRLAERDRRARLTPEQRLQERLMRLADQERVQTEIQANALKTLQTLEEYGIPHGLTPAHLEALASPDSAPVSRVLEWKQLANEAVRQARRIQEAYEHKLVTDAEARAAAFADDLALGEVGNLIVENREHQAVGLDGEPVAHLAQLPDGNWVVHTADPDQPDQVFQSWKSAARHYIGVVSAHDAEQGGASLPEPCYDPAHWIREHPEEELPAGFIFHPAAAKAVARLSAERKAARRRSKPVGAESGPWGEELSDEELQQKLEKEAELLHDANQNHALLELVGSQAGRQMDEHIAAGAREAIALAASEILGGVELPPELVDLVGSREAAKILAYAIRRELEPAEYEAVLTAMETYHARQSRQLTAQVLAEARPLVAQQKEVYQRIRDLEQQAAGREYTLEERLEIDNLTYESEQVGQRVRKLLGNAIGYLEAEAALVSALELRPSTLRWTGKELNRFGPRPEEKLAAFGVGRNEVALGLLADGTESLELSEAGLAKLARFYPDRRAEYHEAQAIKRGEQDEPNWLPAGFVKRPKITFTDPRLAAQQFQVKLELTEEQSDEEAMAALRAYVGARVANGDDPLLVMNAILSPGFYLSLGWDPYGPIATRAQRLAIAQIQALSGEKGDVTATAVKKAFRDWADAEAARQRRARQTDDLQALHSQVLDREIAVEAGHRVLASMPVARLAFKAIDQMSRRERRLLRDYGLKEVLGWEIEPEPEARDSKPDPQYQEFDLFGNPIDSTETEQLEKKETWWAEFSRLMGGDERAYEALQDHLRGRVYQRFANAYSAVAGKPLLIGLEPQAHVERLETAKLPPEKRQEMLDWLRSRQQSDIAKVRRRVGGRFATELDPEWIEKLNELRGVSRQLSLVPEEQVRSQDPAQFMRTALGEQAEQQLQQLMTSVLPTFEQIQDPVALYPDENWGAGTQNVAKQRFIKLFLKRKKALMWFGVGSGKTSTVLGAFTEAQRRSDGPRKLVAAVPSVVVGQFLGEAATFLQPGRYKPVANLGLTRQQRLDALRGDADMVFTTRESLVQDVIALIQQHHGVDTEAFAAADPSTQRQWVDSALRKEGIDPSTLMVAVDEAQDATSRAGVEPSLRSQVLDALAHLSGWYVEATGTPHKNDLSEIYSALHRVDPERFQDRNQFMRLYETGGPGSQRLLQRLVAPYSYVVSIPPTDPKTKRPIQRIDRQPSLPLSDYQQAERNRILSAYKTLNSWYRKANKNGIDLSAAYDDPQVRDALELLGSPNTYGRLSEDQKRAVAGQMVVAGAALRDSALFRLYHLAPYEHNPKMRWTVQQAVERAKSGQPGVIFAARLQSAQELAERLKHAGIKVGLIHGGLGPEEKEQAKLAFNPPKGQERTVDVLICTDAAQTGMNAQSGRWMIQYDIPYTAKAWEQRAARIHRRGQTQDVEILTPLLDSPEERIAWARKERKGAEGSPFQLRSELLDDSGLAGEIERARLMAAA